MKKVNLINKKIMSTGLAASLLVASLGVNSCSAYQGTNVSVKKLTSSQSRVSLAKTKSTPQPTKVKRNISKESIKSTNAAGTPAENSNKTIETTKEKEDKKEITSKPRVKIILPEETSLNKTNNNDKVDVETQTELENEYTTNKAKITTNESKDINVQAKTDGENNAETQVNENKNSNNEFETNESNSISKIEMAKTVAKVVAAAAIVGAATYFGYKYKAPIAETLTKGGAYLSNKTSSFANSCKNGFATSKDYLANKTSSFANSYKNGFATSKDYLTNKTNSFANSCKNGFATSKDYLANKAASIISNIKGLFHPKCTDLVPYINPVNSKCTDSVPNIGPVNSICTNAVPYIEPEKTLTSDNMQISNKVEAILRALKNEIENNELFKPKCTDSVPYIDPVNSKSFFTSAKDYLANKTGSFANSCKNGLVASKAYLANKITSFANSCKNGFTILKNFADKTLKSNETLKTNSAYTNSFVFDDMNKENLNDEFYINHSPIMEATEKSVNGNIYMSDILKKLGNYILNTYKNVSQPIDMTRRHR